MSRRTVIEGLFADSQQERSLLTAIGFTSAFATCRGVTHAIKNNIPPFHNISSKGGTHIHHSTFGILGMLGIGFLWAQQVFTGTDDPPRWGSRVTATTFGIAAALTLDEYALWLDLHDDYWDAQGRKSIDAVAIFTGLLAISVLASEALNDAGVRTYLGKYLVKLDIRRGIPGVAAPGQTLAEPAHPEPAQSA